MNCLAARGSRRMPSEPAAPNSSPAPSFKEAPVGYRGLPLAVQLPSGQSLGASKRPRLDTGDYEAGMGGPDAGRPASKRPRLDTGDYPYHPAKLQRAYHASKRPRLDTGDYVVWRQWMRQPSSGLQRGPGWIPGITRSSGHGEKSARARASKRPRLDTGDYDDHRPINPAAHPASKRPRLDTGDYSSEVHTVYWLGDIASKRPRLDTGAYIIFRFR